MLGNAHYYNRTIRKIVVSFGTLFNDIFVIRYTKDGLTPKERFRVPLSYGPKEKYLTAITSDPTLTKSIAVTVPRMSFELMSMTYDASRKLQSTQQNFALDENGKLATQYMPVPYDFEFSFSIYVRNTEDGTQIVEQILPFFTPDFTVSIKLNPEMDKVYDIPIILNSVNTTIDYEGDTLSTRLIIWDLTFTVKGWLWPIVKKDISGLIGAYSNVGGPYSNGGYGSATTNIFIDEQKTDFQKVYVDYANGNNVFTTGEVVRVSNKDITGKVFYFSNNSTGTLILEDLTKLTKPGDKLTGDYSGAVYTISTVDLTPFKAVEIITKPVPEDAQPDDAFGFSETITEWPDTLL